MIDLHRIERAARIVVLLILLAGAAVTLAAVVTL